MGGSRAALGWAGIAVVLILLSVPWFLWGSSAVVAGLPVWIWWHVGWMIVCAAVFAVFARYAWGVGIETAGGGDVDG